MSHRSRWISRLLLSLAFTCSFGSILFSLRQPPSISIYNGHHVPIQPTSIQANRKPDEPDRRKKQQEGSPPRQQQHGHRSSLKLPVTDLLDSFRPEHAPILPGVTPDAKNPVRVRVLLFLHQSREIAFRKGKDWAIGDEVLNICMDGWTRSPYFHLVNATIVPDFHVEPDFVVKETRDTVWVADMRRMLYNAQYTIPKQLLDAANKTIQWQRQNNINATLKVVLMDYRDRAFPTRCTKGARQLIQLLGGEPGNVVSVVQQVVQDRYWNKTAHFPTCGHVWNGDKDAACFGRPTLHVPYTVRSDYAQAIQEEYQHYLPALTTNKKQNMSPADTERPIDVAHFWTSIEGAPEANLRNAVSDLVVSLNMTKPKADSVGLRVIGSAVSGGSTVGRTKVSSEYLKCLLTSKIVVVAQRDKWEDHYRLFEALVGGALVMTDPMITLPDGLVDTQSVVVYKSLDHLHELLLYFLEHANEQERLQIAREGTKVATTQHRSHHWMELLFFGQRSAD